MKVALCLEYPIGLRGGVSVLVETLLRELTRLGHEVVLVSPDDSATLRQSEAGSLIREHFHWDPIHRPSIANAKKLARQLAESRVALAHFHAGGNYGWGNRFPWHSPVYFLDRLGIPCVTTVHLVVDILDGYCGAQKPVWFKILMLPLAWWGKMQQVRHVRREIAVSQHDVQKLRRWYRPFRDRFVQIYHSRLTQGSLPVPPAKREPVILNVGHIAWRKGQVVLAEAFAQIAARHPEWTLQLAGQGADEVFTEQICRITREHRLDGRIRVLGKRNDALALMQRAAIYVQPSFWEALGLALQEAMFCGCACIGSRAGGIPELIQDGRTGILVEPGVVAQFSGAIEKLIADETLRGNMGRAAAASIQDRGMTVETMVKRHLELYESIVAGN
ncbi:MAG: glycosyltransferase family 4 protein [Verrucomicrobiota bacterium]